MKRKRKSCKPKNSSYEHMYDRCAILTHAPRLPKISSSQNCYRNMFSNESPLLNIREDDEKDKSIIQKLRKIILPMINNVYPLLSTSQKNRQ